ncbi:MAG: response regulator [Candidatus Sulfotelmatobacter sp.]
MKILVIEDEPKTAKFLQKGFGEAGFVVDVAEDGLEGLHLALEMQFDLIVLDIMLPSIDGWRVLTRLRQSGKQALVLILLARLGFKMSSEGIAGGAL